MRVNLDPFLYDVNKSQASTGKMINSINEGMSINQFVSVREN